MGVGGSGDGGVASRFGVWVGVGVGGQIFWESALFSG